MEPLVVTKNRPEALIQTRIVNMLTLRGWFVKSTHGNAYQAGFPDLFCCHSSYGVRWVEVKNPKKYRFTEDQLTVFTNFARRRVGVWVMTGEDMYDCLMRPANWHTFLHKSRGITIKDKVEIIPKKGPEAEIQNALIENLSGQDWFCIETYGSIYQSGLPDLFVCHKDYGTRWIECKNPLRYSFTPAQIKTFPRFEAEGVGVWVLTNPYDTHKLDNSPNWREYLK